MTFKPIANQHKFFHANIIILLEINVRRGEVRILFKRRLT